MQTQTGGQGETIQSENTTAQKPEDFAVNITPAEQPIEQPTEVQASEQPIIEDVNATQADAPVEPPVNVGPQTEEESKKSSLMPEGPTISLEQIWADDSILDLPANEQGTQNIKYPTSEDIPKIADDIQNLSNIDMVINGVKSRGILEPLPIEDIVVEPTTSESNNFTIGGVSQFKVKEEDDVIGKVNKEYKNTNVSVDSNGKVLIKSKTAPQSNIAPKTTSKKVPTEKADGYYRYNDAIYKKIKGTWYKDANKTNNFKPLTGDYVKQRVKVLELNATEYKKTEAKSKELIKANDIIKNRFGLLGDFDADELVTAGGSVGAVQGLNFNMLTKSSVPQKDDKYTESGYINFGYDKNYAKAPTEAKTIIDKSKEPFKKQMTVSELSDALSSTGAFTSISPDANYSEKLLDFASKTSNDFNSGEYHSSFDKAATFADKDVMYMLGRENIFSAEQREDIMKIQAKAKEIIGDGDFTIAKGKELKSLMTSAETYFNQSVEYNTAINEAYSKGMSLDSYNLDQKRINYKDDFNLRDNGDFQDDAKATFESSLNLADFIQDNIQEGKMIQDKVNGGYKFAANLSFIEQKWLETELYGLVTNHEKVKADRFATINAEISDFKNEKKENLADLSVYNSKLKKLDPNSEEYKSILSEISTINKRNEFIDKTIDNKKVLTSTVFLTDPKGFAATTSKGMTSSAEDIFNAIPTGITPKQKFDLFYQQLSKNNDKLAKSNGIDEAYLTGVSRRVRDVLDWGGYFSLSDSEKEYLNNKALINKLTPLYYNNDFGFTQSSGGFWESFMNGVANTLTPVSAQAEGYFSQSQAAGATSDFLAEKGFKGSDLVDKDSLEKLKEEAKTEFWSSEKWGEMIGTTTGIIAPMVITKKIPLTALKVASRAESLILKTKNVQNIATYLTRAESVYVNAMKQNKFTKFLIQPIKSGLEFEATGRVFGSTKEEMYFMSGLAGGVASEAFAGLIAKLPTSEAFKYVQSVFGDKTNMAVEALKKVGEMNVRGIVETAEEFGNELSNIYNKKLKDEGFFDAINAQFGTLDQVQEFVISTYVMGAGFGIASGSSKTAAYESLSDTKKKQVDDILDTIQSEMSSANAQVDDYVQEQERVIKKEEKINPEQEQKIESAESGGIQFDVDNIEDVSEGKPEAVAESKVVPSSFTEPVDLLNLGENVEENKQGLPSEEQGRQEPIQAEPQQGTGNQETIPSGVVQETQGEEVATPAEAVVEPISEDVKVTRSDIPTERSKINDEKTLDGKYYVPRQVFEEAYKNDTGNIGAQSLDSIISRGGYSAKELDRLLPNWKELTVELNKPKAEPTIIAEITPIKETQAPEGITSEVEIAGIMKGYENIQGNENVGDIRNLLPIDKNVGVITKEGKDGNQYVVAFSKVDKKGNTLREYAPSDRQGRPGYISAAVKIEQGATQEEINLARQKAIKAINAIVPTIENQVPNKNTILNAISESQNQKVTEPAIVKPVAPEVEVQPTEEVAEPTPIINKKDQEEVDFLDRQINATESKLIDIQDEMDIEKGNVREEKDRIREEKAKVRSSKMPKDEKQERLLELDSELEDIVNDHDDLIESYKQDMSQEKSDLRKYNNKKSRIQQKAKVTEVKAEEPKVEPVVAEEKVTEAKVESKAEAKPKKTKTVVSGLSRSGTKADFIIDVSKDGKTANVKRAPFESTYRGETDIQTPTQKQEDTNLPIKTNINNERYIETPSGSTVYIDRVKEVEETNKTEKVVERKKEGKGAEISVIVEPKNVTKYSVPQKLVKSPRNNTWMVERADGTLHEPSESLQEKAEAKYQETRPDARVTEIPSTNEDNPPKEMVYSNRTNEWMIKNSDGTLSPVSEKVQSLAEDKYKESKKGKTEKLTEKKKVTKEKISKAFDDLKLGKDKLYALPVPPGIINAILEAAKQLTLTGVDFGYALKQAAVNVTTELKGKGELTDTEVNEIIDYVNNEYQGRPEVSGIKNELSSALAKDIAEKGIDRMSIKEVLDAGEEAVNSGEINPTELIDSIVNVRGRTLEPIETAAMIHYKTSLDNDLETAYTNLNKALESNDTYTEADARAKVSNLETKLLDYEVMSNITGYRAGFTFRIRQLMLNSEYDIVKIKAKMATQYGGKLPADVAQRLSDMDARLRALNAKIQELEKNSVNEAESDAINKLKNSKGKLNAKQKKKEAELKATSKDGKIKVPVSLIRDAIEGGAKEIEDVINSVRDLVKSEFPNATDRQIRDAITNYGKTYQMTSDEIKKEINRMNRVGRMISQLEDLEKGKKKAKTDAKRDVISQREAYLKKKIKEELAKIPLTQEEILAKDADRLESFKRRQKESIEELQRKIAEGDFTTNNKSRFLELDEEASKLKAQREKVKLEFDKEFEKARLQNRGWKQSIMDGLINAINLPKALVASLDLSAPFRQGAVMLFSQNPVTSLKQISKMLEFWAKENSYDAYLSGVKSSPHYELMKSSGLFIAEQNAKLSAKEEAMMSNWANYVPILGKSFPLKGGKEIRVGFDLYGRSERAYVGFLNKLRVDTFLDMAEKMSDMGISPQTNIKEYKDWAKYVNNATGRGTGTTSFEMVAAPLSTIFFSPRLIASRLNVGLNPVFYGKMSPIARKAAMKQTATFFGVAASILGLAAMGLKYDDDDKTDVVLDPRSSDFAKIKIGNVRIDILAGFQQYYRTISQFLSNRKVNIQTGEVKQLGTQYGGETRGDVLTNLFLNKLAPIPSLVYENVWSSDAEKKQREEEEGSGFIKTITDLSIPLYLQGEEDLVKECGYAGAAALTLLNIFGGGVQNMPPKAPKASDYKTISSGKDEYQDDYKDEYADDYEDEYKGM